MGSELFKLIPKDLEHTLGKTNKMDTFTIFVQQFVYSIVYNTIQSDKKVREIGCKRITDQ